MSLRFGSDAEHPPLIAVAVRHRLTGGKRLADLPMTPDDWRKVYYAYQGFVHQVRLIADEVERRSQKEEAAG